MKKLLILFFVNICLAASENPNGSGRTGAYPLIAVGESWSEEESEDDSFALDHPAYYPYSTSGNTGRISISETFTLVRDDFHPTSEIFTHDLIYNRIGGVVVDSRNLMDIVGAPIPFPGFSPGLRYNLEDIRSYSMFMLVFNGVDNFLMQAFLLVFYTSVLVRNLSRTRSFTEIITEPSIVDILRRFDTIMVEASQQEYLLALNESLYLHAFHGHEVEGADEECILEGTVDMNALERGLQGVLLAFEEEEIEEMQSFLRVIDPTFTPERCDSTVRFS